MAGTVRPVLFVGCGGSGGVTLRFAMDALRAEVRRWNDARELDAGDPGARIDFSASKGIPQCWQFVHIDVPSQPDGNSPTRPPSVPDQGGTYVTVAPSGFKYPTVSDQLWRKSTGKATQHLLTGWMKAPNPATDPPLTSGAGQMRNAGRTVTLFSLGTVVEALDGAAKRLVSAEAQADLAKLARLRDAEESTNPVVLIVSSMSGGAGASMVLDVARVLSRLRPDWVGLTSMFLYTSEVFSTLPEVNRTGVEGNGLAALGELLATSLGANGTRPLHGGDGAEIREAVMLDRPHDENQLLADLGVAAGGRGDSQTYRRVFPIGNSQGQNAALFGDGSMEVVYRAIGRGLAGLVAAPTALSDFADYDLTNANYIPTDMALLGTGAASEQSVLWGSFGFARLSLGRDRYGEYLAQRLARAAVDRLCGASGPARASAERDAALAADAAFARLRLDLGLQEGPLGDPLLALLGRKSGQREARNEIAAFVRPLLAEQLYGHPQVVRATNAADFPGQLHRVGTGIAKSLMTQINDHGYQTVFAWVDDFVSDALRLVEGIAARHGIGVARRVVLTLKDEVRQWSRDLTSQGQQMAPDGGSTLPPAPGQLLAQIEKLHTPFLPNDPLRLDLRNKHLNGVCQAAAGRMATDLGRALLEFGDGFCTPLVQSLQGKVEELEAARIRGADRAGVAEARSEVYADWPTATGDVPTRFHGAHNEVMLLDPNAFPAQVDADLEIIRGARGLTTVVEAREAALVEIITDRWDSHNDAERDAQTIRVTAPWVASALIRDPNRPDVGRMASRARFEILDSPNEVVQRARSWVFRPKGELAPVLRQGIRTFLAGPDGKPSEARSAELAGKFAIALQHASPLIQVSGAAFGIVHQGTALRPMFKFSSVPLRSLAGQPADELKGVLRDRNAQPEALTGLDAALNEDMTTQHVDIFGSYAPMSPLAISSLIKPLGAAINRAENKNDVASMWRNRRARPLPGSLAMAPEERRALIAGYVVGRMTGRLRGSYVKAAYGHDEPLAVYDEGGAEWLRFPTLLTPHVSPFESDEVAALLEAHLVAIAECGSDASLAPLHPYQALRELYGRAVRTADTRWQYDPLQGARRILSEYIVKDASVPGSGPRRADMGAGGATTHLTPAQQRKASAKAYLDALSAGVRESFGGADPQRSPYVERMRYETRPLLNALAPDLLWAVERLSALVDAIDPDDLPTTPDDARPKVIF